MKKLIGLVAIALLVGSCGIQQKHDINGSIVMFSSKAEYGTKDDSKPCINTGGFSDINQNESVVVKNGKGEILAVGRIGQGKWEKVEEIKTEMGTTKDIIACVFPFHANDIPESDNYAIAIGNRKDQTYSLAEMKQKEKVSGNLKWWSLRLKI